MQPREKILDDVARFAGGAASALSGIRRQVKEEMRVRIDELAVKFDLVPREDFEKLERVVIKAREEQAKLIERISALEKALAGKTAKPQTSKTTKKSKTKKA